MKTVIAPHVAYYVLKGEVCVLISLYEAKATPPTRVRMHGPEAQTKAENGNGLSLCTYKNSPGNFLFLTLAICAGLELLVLKGGQDTSTKTTVRFH